MHAAEFMDKFIKRNFDSDKSESSENKQLSRSESISRKKTNFRRFYCDDCIKFGFHWTGDEHMPIAPLCVVCGQKLSIEAIVPSKLKRHCITNHSNLQTITIVYFQRLLPANSRQSKYFRKQSQCQKEFNQLHMRWQKLLHLNQSLMSLLNQ